MGGGEGGIGGEVGGGGGEDVRGGSRTKIGGGGVCKRDVLGSSMVSTIVIGGGEECEEIALLFLRPV